MSKCVKADGSEPTEIEASVATELKNLEQGSSEIKVELRELTFLSAREVDVGGGKKAIIIFVPFPQLKKYNKIQTRLVRELEKKFSGRIVVIIAQRRILRKPLKKERLGKQMRPRSRTLTAVHDAILEDMVYPTQIVGKRLRVQADGTKVLKVLLDPNAATQLEYKLDAFTTVYKKMTNKEAIFEFPVVPTE